MRTTATVLVCLLLGCSSRPSRIEVPSINASAAAEKAIEQFDTDGNGSIGGDELKQVASIGNSLKQLDTDGNQAVSADELAARMQAWADNKAGAIPATLTLIKSGRPVAGAKVTLEPESFLADKVSLASGVSEPNGMVDLYSEAVSGGMQVGFYKIRISKVENGKETIPAKYNTETTLGIEIHAGAAAASTTAGERIELK